ncbi:hypothetical protein IKF63_01630 [Candidatus Saccharibacteria bacterium]|nr:hypothetical protein [Candidatus Saccharibacteria bacterium]
MIKKLIILVLVFALGFLSCYTLLVNKTWYKDFNFSKVKLVANDCDKVVREIEKYDWDAKMATAVMKAESKCDVNTKGDTDLVFEENGREYGYSVGAFQVRILPGREECDTFDLEKNVSCAYNIYVDAGRNFKDWSMFLNGKYREFLDE